MTDYLLDANVFIQAKNLHYGFDFCPAFWNWLDEQNRAGKVASIEKVADELHAGTDELAGWAAARGDGFFLSPDDTVVPALHTVSNWASTQGYEPAAVATFLQVADYCSSLTRWHMAALSSVTKFPPRQRGKSKFQMPASGSVCVA